MLCDPLSSEKTSALAALSLVHFPKAKGQTAVDSWSSQKTCWQCASKRKCHWGRQQQWQQLVRWGVINRVMIEAQGHQIYRRSTAQRGYMTATTLCKHVTSDRPAVMCFVLGSFDVPCEPEIPAMGWKKWSGTCLFRKSVGCGGPKLVRARVDVWAVHLLPGPFVRCETHTRGREFESLSLILFLFYFSNTVRVETDTHTHKNWCFFFFF